MHRIHETYFIQRLRDMVMVNIANCKDIWQHDLDTSKRDAAFVSDNGALFTSANRCDKTVE